MVFYCSLKLGITCTDFAENFDFEKLLFLLNFFINEKKHVLKLQ